MGKNQNPKNLQKLKNELNQIAKELEEITIDVVNDYNEVESDMSGSIVVIHENSKILNER